MRLVFTIYFPNRITKLEQIAQPLVVRFFCGTAERRKRAFVSDDGAQKTASASAECRFASVSMMARGGREKASQRLNPESLQSPSQVSGRAILFDLLNIC